VFTSGKKETKMKRKSLRQVFHEHPGLFRDLERRDRGFGSRAPILEGWSGLLDRIAARIEALLARRPEAPAACGPVH